MQPSSLPNFLDHVHLSCRVVDQVTIQALAVIDPLASIVQAREHLPHACAAHMCPARADASDVRLKHRIAHCCRISPQCQPPWTQQQHQQQRQCALQLVDEDYGGLNEGLVRTACVLCSKQTRVKQKCSFFAPGIAVHARCHSDRALLHSGRLHLAR